MRARAILVLTALGVASCRHVAPEAPQTNRITPGLAPKQLAIAAHVRFFLESVEGGAPVVSLPQSRVNIPVRGEPVLTEADIVDVDIVQAELGHCLVFRLTADGAQRITQLAGRSRGLRLVLAVNDVTLGARRIDQPLADGSLAMFVEVPDVYLPRLLASMKPNATRVGPSSLSLERK